MSRSERGLPLRCTTLNMSWEANTTKPIKHGTQFHNVQKDARGIPLRWPLDNTVSRAYQKSANAIIQTNPDIILLQEFSVSSVLDPSDVPLVAKNLFGKNYTVVATKLTFGHNTWYGNLILARTTLLNKFTFTDLQIVDFYSKMRGTFSEERPLAAVIMAPTSNLSNPVMLICSVHSAHYQNWGLEASTKRFKIIIESAMDYYKSKISPAKPSFKQMGFLFGGDLNTTQTCSWGQAAHFTCDNKETFEIKKTPSSILSQNTLTSDHWEQGPRDWIFGTSRMNPNTCIINSFTGSDHYALVAQTSASMATRKPFIDDAVFRSTHPTAV